MLSNHHAIQSQKSKLLVDMKLSLKNKIILYSILTNLIIAVSIGGVLYKYAGELYYKAFLDSKESLARSIALTIDGDKHKTLTTLESAKDPEYQKYLNYLNQIKLQEKYITYLFTINYDRKNDKLSYIVDSDILTTDTIWITTEFFGFALFIGKDDKITIKYNENFHTKDFDVFLGKEKFRLKFGENGTLYIDGKELVKIISKSPLALEASGKKLNLNSRELYSNVYIKDKPVELYCSFTANGESQSIPGELYAESKEVVELSKKIIISQKNTIVRREAKTSIYGVNTSTVYGIIKDSKGEANGLVVIELFHREISNFNRSILWIFLLVSLVTFIATISLTSIFSKYIITPIEKLTYGANQVGNGNLDYKIEVKRTDEFGVLGNTFNHMVENLKKSNNELNHLKDHLEVLVEERTQQLKNSNTKLDSAISEVSTLKGLLPICSSCNNIRDEKGNWNQIETYIRKHSQADFTHSICPDCVRKLYPEMYKKINKPV